MDVITLDFETYYDKDYSLSKLTTEEYVRDSRFEVIGVSLKFNEHPAHWFGNDESIKHALGLVPWDKVALLCHNTNFDGLILSQHYGVVPKIYLDTLSMARPWHLATVGGSLKKLAIEYQLGEKGEEVLSALGKHRNNFTAQELNAYGKYCMNDTELTYKLFQELKKKTPVQELLLIDRTVRMFCHPLLLLNRDVIVEDLNHEINRKAELLKQVEEIAPKEVLMSNPKLQILLESLGVEVPTKVSVKTGKSAPAFSKTDKAFQALLEYECPYGSGNDELVRSIVSARLGVKSTIDETRAVRFLGLAERGALPVDLLYCGAWVTQRWSGGSKQNLQNLRRGGALRRSITAPEGQMVVAVDSSNIELRVNHTLAEQAASVDAFRNKRDLYCEFASLLYGREITKADKLERQMGKLAHLSLGYGCGADKFGEICRLNKVDLSKKEAKRIVTMWRTVYGNISAMWKHFDALIEHIAAGHQMSIDTQGLLSTDKDIILTRPHNQIQYPGLAYGNEQWTYKVRNEIKYLYGAKMVENVCQHLARNIIAEQLLRISAKYPVVLTVHDEVVYLAPEDEAEEALAFGVAEMSKSPDWWPNIPLAAEGEFGRTYS